jgi:hypothetical protein
LTELSLVLPEIGKADKTQDPRIVTALTAITTFANGNIDSSNIKPSSIEEGSIKEGAVTGKKLGAETVRLLSGATYSALTGGTSAKEEEPSATRPTYVMWMVNAAASQQPGPPFWVLPGEKWKVTVATVFAVLAVGGVELATVQLGGNVTSFRYSYRTF